MKLANGRGCPTSKAFRRWLRSMKPVRVRLGPFCASVSGFEDTDAVFASCFAGSGDASARIVIEC